MINSVPPCSDVPSRERDTEYNQDINSNIFGMTCQLKASGEVKKLIPEAGDQPNQCKSFQSHDTQGVEGTLAKTSLMGTTDAKSTRPALAKAASNELAEHCSGRAHPETMLGNEQPIHESNGCNHGNQSILESAILESAILESDCRDVKTDSTHIRQNDQPGTSYQQITFGEISLHGHERFLQKCELFREEVRRQTFIEGGWKSSLSSLSVYARLGFFYLGNDSRVQCFSCAGELTSRYPGEDVEGVHKYYYHDCEMVNGTDASNIPLSENARNACDLAYQQQFPELIEELPDPSPDEKRLLATTFPCLYPEHPEMVSFDLRCESFKNWPKKIILKISFEKMAESGLFYTGESDKVECFYCNGCLSNWTRSDDPWTFHAIWFPTCEYLLSQKGDEYVKRLLKLFPIDPEIRHLQALSASKLRANRKGKTLGKCCKCEESFIKPESIRQSLPEGALSKAVTVLKNKVSEKEGRRKVNTVSFNDFFKSVVADHGLFKEFIDVVERYAFYKNKKGGKKLDATKEELNRILNRISLASKHIELIFPARNTRSEIELEGAQPNQCKSFQSHDTQGIEGTLAKTSLMGTTDATKSTIPALAKAASNELADHCSGREPELDRKADVIKNNIFLACATFYLLKMIVGDFVNKDLTPLRLRVLNEGKSLVSNRERFLKWQQEMKQYFSLGTKKSIEEINDSMKVSFSVNSDSKVDFKELSESFLKRYFSLDNEHQHIKMKGHNVLSVCISFGLSMEADVFSAGSFLSYSCQYLHEQLSLAWSLEGRVECFASCLKSIAADSLFSSWCSIEARLVEKMSQLNTQKKQKLKEERQALLEKERALREKQEKFSPGKNIPIASDKHYKPGSAFSKKLSTTSGVFQETSKPGEIPESQENANESRFLYECCEFLECSRRELSRFSDPHGIKSTLERIHFVLNLVSDSQYKQWQGHVKKISSLENDGELKILLCDLLKFSHRFYADLLKVKENFLHLEVHEQMSEVSIDKRLKNIQYSENLSGIKAAAKELVEQQSSSSLSNMIPEENIKLYLIMKLFPSTATLFSEPPGIEYERSVHRVKKERVKTVPVNAPKARDELGGGSDNVTDTLFVYGGVEHVADTISGKSKLSDDLVKQCLNSILRQFDIGNVRNRKMQTKINYDDKYTVHQVYHHSIGTKSHNTCSLFFIYESPNIRVIAAGKHVGGSCENYGIHWRLPGLQVPSCLCISESRVLLDK